MTNQQALCFQRHFCFLFSILKRAPNPFD